MKKIIQVCEKASIWADNMQYLVKWLNSTTHDKKGNIKHNYEKWYMGSMANCFDEIYECLLREKLVAGEEKEMKDVLRIIDETRNEIRNVLEKNPISELEKVSK